MAYSTKQEMQRHIESANDYLNRAEGVMIERQKLRNVKTLDARQAYLDYTANITSLAAMSTAHATLAMAKEKLG